jgi:protein-tyrosine kinase
MNDRVARHSVAGNRAHRLIGEHLVDLGVLRAEDIPRVIEAQQRYGLLFGQSAVRARLIDSSSLDRALARQYVFPIARPEHGLAPELIMAHQPDSAAAECIRNLRVQIGARLSRNNLNAIAIVSTEPREGRSFIAANLAVAYAQRHVRTLLIDMDLRRPRQHALFGLTNRQGFSSALIGRSDAEQIRCIPGHDALAVMTSGPLPPNPLELLECELSNGLLETLRFQYELVIVDTPSWTAGADAQVIGAHCGAAVLVSRPDHAVSHVTGRFLSMLGASGVHMIGALVNAV